MSGAICGGRTAEGTKLPMNALFDVGFGEVRLTRNGRLVWSYLRGPRRKLTTHWAERRARASSPARWEVKFDAPLSGATYRRFGRNDWRCVASDLGFA